MTCFCHGSHLIVILGELTKLLNGEEVTQKIRMNPLSTVNNLCGSKIHIFEMSKKVENFSQSFFGEILVGNR